MSLEVPANPQESNSGLTTTFSTNISSGFRSTKGATSIAGTIRKGTEPKILVIPAFWSICGVPVLHQSWKKKKKGYNYKEDKHTAPVTKSTKVSVQEASKQPMSLTRGEVSREMKNNLEWHGLVGWGMIIHSFCTVESTQHILNVQGGSFKTKVAIFHRTKDTLRN